MLEAFRAVKGAFVVATTIGVVDQAVVPPFGGDVIEEVVDDAIAERGGEDFPDDWFGNQESDAATGFVSCRRYIGRRNTACLGFWLAFSFRIFLGVFIIAVDFSGGSLYQ